MKTLLPVVVILLVLGGACACSGVATPDDDQPDLGAPERAKVVSKSEKAFQEGSWVVAWDEAVRAKASRERLEAIAIEAMAPADPVLTPPAAGSATEMFAKLRERYGGLTAGSRATVSERSLAYGEAHRWTQAVELELAAADDPPRFTGAWVVYERSPVWKTTAIRDLIEEAVKAHEKAKDEKAKDEAAAGSDG